MACTAIENHIRNTTQTKRIRPSEFFLDYDRLRSGYVTATQFYRVLWENLGLKFDEAEQQAVTEKYALKGDGRVNYQAFCAEINQPFDPNNVGSLPEVQKNNTIAGAQRSVRPLSAESEQRVGELLVSLQRYYKYRGLNLRTSCEDFDKHHIGVIQESQFYRSFLRPPEVTESDIALLVRKYRDPERPGLLKYLNLHDDLEAAGSQEEKDVLVLPSETDISHFLPRQPGADTTLQQIFDRIRVAVFKNGIRTIEFFKDYDKLRSGTITANQFHCGLSLGIGKEAQLTRAEIQKITEFYRADESRVRYKEFCEMMENAFNVPDLEKKPTLDVVRPPQGALGRNLPSLNNHDEERVREVLEHLSDQVRKRRLMMYQYFKDYDRSKGYSRVITSSQFGRILHFLSLNVAPEDFKLICRKFSDPATGDVNYPAFVQTVDKEFVNYTQDAPQEETKQLSLPTDLDLQCITRETVSISDVMARIRHHAFVNRRRICEFFQDFDPLRSGSITKSQFRRGLSCLGMSALGDFNLSEAHFEALCSMYQDPDKPDQVLWNNFMNDAESVGESSENKNSVGSFTIPKPGTMDWSCASEEHMAFFAQIMERLRARTNQRRVLAKPVFQDFDRHNKGHVTRSQFRQCLTMLELHCEDDQMQTLEAMFCNDTGFNYIAFLKELEPGEPRKLMYGERLEQLRLANQKVKIPEGSVAKDLQGVLEKIKTTVYKERVRIHEWTRDYDKLRSGRIKKTNLRRALDLCKFELAESEIAILEDHYQSPEDPDYVDYLLFSDDIESIFTTKHLEKTPTLEVTRFCPPAKCELNALEPEMENLMMKSMESLAEKVRKNRIQLFPLFEDYDKVHNGTVSRSQFRRVLNELELASLVASEQEWVCLWKKFDVRVGGKDDVNYIAFCDMIYHLAHFEWRKP